MTPKIVDKEERKKEIALAALEVFLRKGFDGASISDIAKEAGIGKGTIYEYFKTKDDIIFQSIIVWMEKIEENIPPEILLIEEPVERIREFTKTLMREFMSDERSVRMFIAMIQLFFTNKEFYSKYDLMNQVFKSMRGIYTEFLLDGVSKGVFWPRVASKAEKIAINITGYLDGIAVHYFMSEGSFDMEEQLDLYFENLINSLLVHGEG